MANFLSWLNGVQQRVTPNTTSAGVADANKLVQLDASGKLDTSLLPSSALAGSEDYSIIASETLASGDLINIYDNAGVANMRKADATDASKPPMGYVQSAVTALASGTARLGNGVITGMTGLTIGARYFLSASTPGAITTTAPSSIGNVVYPVGRAKSATEFTYIDDTTPILLQ